MRKSLSFVIALSLLLLLTACGGTKAPATNQQAPATPQTEQPAEQPKKDAEPAPAPKPSVELIVSAAASMTDALNELKSSYEAEHQGITLRFNYGSSGALQQQIEQGAPADLFISAGKKPMTTLVEKGFIEEAKVTNVVSNKVVLIRGKSAADVVKGWEDLTAEGVKRIAIGNPEHVPVGQYTKAVLEHLDLWSQVESRLVLAEDVRQVLNFVESGEVEAGMVYSTDAAVSDKVIVIAEAPEGSHAPVVYPMAVLKDSKHSAEASALADYLLSEKGRALLAKYGFGPGQ